MNRLLIVDIESYLYKSITAAKMLHQDNIHKNIYYEAYDINKSILFLEDNLNRLMDKLQASNCELVIGDKNNFRKVINPDYKSNRPSKPPIYEVILNVVNAKFKSISLQNLEADDTCRILYEDKSFHPNLEKIIVSIDKDFFTVPCKFFRDLPNNGLIDIDIDTAQYNLYKQIITGDKDDHYEGIPGYGEVKAKKFLEFSRDEKDVIKLFEENGLTKEDYYKNKYMAQLISISQYNFNTGEVYYDR